VSDETLPYRVDAVESVASVREGNEGLAPDTHTGTHVVVAGRLVLLRRQGGVLFADLEDQSGRIQLLITRATTKNFADIVASRVVGDWITAAGEIISSRRGELSIEVAELVLLAHSRHGLGDKFHGVTDPDTRYRQRYLDMWANPGVRARLIARSKAISAIRHYLEEQGFLEVETPILQPLASGATARPFVTHHNAFDVDLYLRIAPELYLKRLVVGGMERVFEIGRNFRNEGISPRHNPEFTMLELYQAYADYTDMMELTQRLIVVAARAINGSALIRRDGQEWDLSVPFRRASMAELVSEAMGQNVSLSMEAKELEALAVSRGCEVPGEWNAGKALVALYEELVESQLQEPTFVTGFPKAVSPLARESRDPNHPDEVERFELVIGGRELVNAFSELNDPEIQRERFNVQTRERASGDDEAMMLDEDYLRALEYGLPPTGGLGLGIDRLMMFLTGATQIKEVITFPALKPIFAQETREKPE